MRKERDKNRALVKKIKRELGYINDVYKETLKNVAKEKLSFEEILLCDNYYIIEQTAKNAVLGLEQIKITRREIGLEYPRIYYHVSDFIDGIGKYEFTDEELAAYLNKRQKDDYYESVEIYSVQNMISAAIVLKIAEFLRAEGDFGSRINELIKLLYLRKNMDYEYVFEKVSKLEEILARDPSGVYPRSDKETKSVYREALQKGAEKAEMKETDYAEKIIAALAQTRGEADSLGAYLLREERTGLKYIYFPLLAFFTLAQAAVYLFLIGDGARILYFALIFLILPFFEVSKQITNMIMARAWTPHIIPRLEISEIPDEMRTLTIVTTLLFGEKTDNAVFERLEDFYNLCKDKNVYFGVLGDLKDSGEPTDADDAEIIDYAVRRIEGLNTKYGNHFALFVRERKYSVGERKYMGWERKRGAIIELTHFLRNKETTISTAIGDIENIKKAKYIITLDSDTRLGHTSIKKLIGSAAHPQNKPRIERGKNGAIVKDGYGIMQPRMISSLESVSKSFFSLIQCGSGGIEFYNNCEFNIYQHIFGEGIFCGKGIFDVDAFCETVDGAYPEDSVLSHDLLEGTRLRAAYLGDIPLVDSAPSAALSYYNRLHRWIRGDTQALAFCRSPINSLSKFKLTDNILRAVNPIFSLAAIIIAVFLRGRSANIIIAGALSYLILPALISFVTPIVSHNVGAYKIILRSYFSYAVSGIVKDSANMLYNIGSLPYLAYISLDAIVRSLWRMCFSHKNMLEWVTAEESERQKNSLWGYLVRMQVSIWTGLAFVVFTSHFLGALLGMMFIVFPFAAYLLSQDTKKPRRSFDFQKKRLTEYAKPMWRFFEDFVNEEDNFLPPDNFQSQPTEATAHRTSPTNIGMYLCSALSARDFGFINSDELYTRLENTVSTVEKMEKWHGHLYNWYDTRTLEILNPSYVSTVDSGNFVCSLLSVKEGILEYAAENTDFLSLSKRMEKLADDTEFLPLYNKKRKLFYIGINPAAEKFDENYYDLYMSEARCASYFAIARGEISDEHWRALGRLFIGDGNHIGLASWSGTAFEYFMPTLFLPLLPNSMAYEGLQFAFSVNRKNGKETKTESGKTKVIWGKSESAFYSFDADMNYRYRAMGESKLGLVRGLEEDRVYAPYALFLMLKVSVKDVLSGLAAMKDVGAYGKYGFFEAIDLTPRRVGNGRAIVKSHMAHHTGMSMVACANACFDDIFCRRFMRVPDMRASALLLSEKLPPDAIIYKKEVMDVDEKSLQIIEKMRARNPRFADTDGCGNEVRSHILSDGNFSVAATSLGDVRISVGTRMITNDNFDEPNAFTLMFTADGEVYPLIADIPNDGKNDKIKKYVFSHSDGKIEYDAVYNGTKKLHANAKISIDSDKGLAIFEFSSEGKFSEICPLFVFEPIMTSRFEYNAHSSFSKLFVEYEFLKDDKILLYRRKNRSEKEKETWLAVAFCESGGDVSFAAAADKILPEMYDTADLKNLFLVDFDDDEGGPELGGTKGLSACVNPICAVKRNSLAGGKYKCDFVICSGSEREKVISSVLEIRREKNRFARCEHKSAVYSVTQEKLAGSNKNTSAVSSVILSSLLYKLNAGGAKENLRMHPLGYDSLWRMGISGDMKIVFVDTSESIARNVIEPITEAHRLLRLRGVRFDLVFLYRGCNEYNNKQKTELERIVSACGSDELISKKGGIFLVGRGEINEAEYELFENISAYNFKCEKSSGAEALFGALPTLPKRKENVIRKKEGGHICAAEKDVGAYKVYGGEFLENGFLADKSFPHGVWSYIYCGSAFGTLVSHNSLGFTWYKNSREMRISEWNPDAMGQRAGEYVFLETDGKSYDLCAISDSVFFGHSCAEYNGSLFGARYKIKVGVDNKLCVKLIKITLDEGKFPENAKIVYSLKPVMGESHKHDNVVDFELDGEAVFVRSLFGASNVTGFVLGLGAPNYKIEHDLCKTVFDANEKTVFAFAVGAFPSFSDKPFKYIKNKYRSPEDIDAAFSDYAEKSEKLFSAVSVNTGNPAYDEMINYYLPYQAYYVRMLARSGFYQSSGAYGFRDQLQDSLAALYYDKNITRAQIIRNAAHQYEEGDVQHWWHGRAYGENFGIRSRYSDDCLWLVFALAEYIEYTGDFSILDVKVNYISSRPLEKRENERCECAKKSHIAESIYAHCVLALEHTLEFGAHGLPLVGGGDWNDGMNCVGIKGKGESVWLCWFLILTLEKFIPICKKCGDDELADKYEKITEKLYFAAEKHAWDGKWYLRGYYDNGEKLGSNESDECQIDIMAQSFASFVENNTGERQTEALESVYEKLFDSKYGIVKLFTPPFSNTKQNPGYIKGYPKGIRENGGQYSHGAVWYAMALLKKGEFKRGYAVIEALNPAVKCSNYELGKIYRNEPYSMSGDIYTARGHYGRGGWSQYTGSASWYYRALIKYALGIYPKYGKITLAPAFFGDFEKYTATVKYMGTVYHITAEEAEDAYLELDGERRPLGKEEKAELITDGKEHTAVLKINNKNTNNC